MQQIYHILRFMLMLVWVIGFIGGVGYCLYYKEYTMSVFVFAMGCMAFPTAKSIFKYYFIENH